MVYVYRRQLSTGARELAQALGGRRFRGRTTPITAVLRPGDVVVCWGETLDPIPGVTIINGGKIRNKFEDALTLQQAGVPTIVANRQRPAAQPVVDENALRNLYNEAVEQAEEFVELPYNRQNPVFVQGIAEFRALLTRLEEQLRNPAQARPQEEWLPRVFNHVGGTDLLNPPAQADYYVRKENIVEEVRIHSFNGKSLRAGKKQPRVAAGANGPHPWIRSYDGGWGIVYDGFESNRTQRELAHSAVKALGLTFGAVDLAKKADGSWFVLEVNRAPGLEGNTIGTYATALQSYLAEQGRAR